MSGIDPSVLRLILALVIVGILIEVIDKISPTAAWTFYAIIVLGILLNNPAALSLISATGSSLQAGVSPAKTKGLKLNGISQ